MAKAATPAAYVVLESFAVGYTTYSKGEVLAPDNPTVKAWPEKFGPLTFAHEDRLDEPVVERATAGPGEKRGA